MLYSVEGTAAGGCGKIELSLVGQQTRRPLLLMTCQVLELLVPKPGRHAKHYNAAAVCGEEARGRLGEGGGEEEEEEREEIRKNIKTATTTRMRQRLHKTVNQQLTHETLEATPIQEQTNQMNLTNLKQSIHHSRPLTSRAGESTYVRELLATATSRGEAEEPAKPRG